MDTAAACIANIGPRERMKRMRFGVVLLGVGSAVLAALFVCGVHRAWRLALLLPYWAGALGLFQALERT